MNTQRKAEEKATLEDKEIVSLYFDRDEKAVSETDKKYGKYLYTIAHNILTNHEDSEECVNDTYQRTWNAIPPTVPKVLRAFLARSTRNLAINRYYREKRQISTEHGSAEDLADFEGFVTDGSVLEDEVAALEIGRIITEYLSGVNEKKLVVFVGRYYYAESVETIASKLGTTKSSVYKILTSMKSELREQLKKEGFNI